jgi:hypothetical protein
MGGELGEEGEERGDGGEGEESTRMGLEKEHQAQMVVCQEGREKSGPQPNWSRRRDAGKKDETRRRSHPEKYAAGVPQDPNNDSPYAHHYTRKTHIQQTEQKVWCIHEEEEERSKRNQTNKAWNSLVSDQKAAQEEWHPKE